MSICPDIDTRVSPCKYYIQGGFCKLPYNFRCVEWLARNTISMSYSSVKDWATCRRKYYYAYIRGIQLRPEHVNIRMMAGTIMSEVLDEVHKVDIDSSIKSRTEVVLAKYANLIVDTSEGGQKISQELSKIRALQLYLIESPFAEIKGQTQCEWFWREPDYPQLHGFLDLLTTIPTIAYEFKYSGSPDIYASKFIVSDQLSTYFLGMPNLQRITLRAIRVPTLRPKKDEQEQDYINRMYEDIKRQPHHYIIDTNFFRSEFGEDMEETKEKARFMVREIAQSVEAFSSSGMAAFYQNKFSCYKPTPCPYLPLCEGSTTKLLNNAILETMYISKVKPYETQTGTRTGSDNASSGSPLQGRLHSLRDEGNGEDDI